MALMLRVLHGALIAGFLLLVEVKAEELTDAQEQEARFNHENRQRVKRGGKALPIDEHLLDALRSGLPECSGVALGIDRLLMYKLGASSLAEVMAFTC